MGKGGGAGRPITGDASADDRLLLVYPLGGPQRHTLISATLRHAILGARRTLTEPAFLAVSDVWLHTDPPLPLDIDGEIRGGTPARITLAPNALRVMVAPRLPRHLTRAVLPEPATSAKRITFGFQRNMYSGNGRVRDRGLF